MKVKINQNQLSRILTKFLKSDGNESDPNFFIKMIKFLTIIGQDEEIGRYILKKIKNREIQNYGFKNNDITGVEIQFSINSFPLILNAERIFFNRGGRVFDFELTSPFIGEDTKLDLSYSLLKKIYSSLFNYE